MLQSEAARLPDPRAWTFSWKVAAAPLWWGAVLWALRVPLARGAGMRLIRKLGVGGLIVLVGGVASAQDTMVNKARRASDASEQASEGRAASADAADDEGGGGFGGDEGDEGGGGKKKGKKGKRGGGDATDAADRAA